MIKASPGQIVPKAYLEKTHPRKGLVVYTSRYRPLIQTPVPPKKPFFV
jgi:hypothetical protein